MAVKVQIRDFDSPTGKQTVLVPNGPIEEFINFVLNTSMWEDDIDMVHRRVKVLRREVMAQKKPMGRPKQKAEEDRLTA